MAAFKGGGGWGSWLLDQIFGKYHYVLPSHIICVPLWVLEDIFNRVQGEASNF